MTSPTNLSHTPSIVTQRVLTPVLGSERSQPSPPRSPTSPAHRMASDVLASAAAFAPPSEGLSFAPPRSPSLDALDLHPIHRDQVDQLQQRLDTPNTTAAAFAPAGRLLVLPRSPSPEARASDLSHTDHVEPDLATAESGDVAVLIASAPLPPQSGKKAPLPTQPPAPYCFATLCDRISTFITGAVTRFVNWIASWFYPSSVAEDLTSRGTSPTLPPVANSDALETGVASRVVTPQALVPAETSAFVADSSSTPPLADSAVLVTAAASRAVTPQPLGSADSATLATGVSSL